jgi:hypothetical protein
MAGSRWFLSSLAGLVWLLGRIPSHKWLVYYQKPKIAWSDRSKIEIRMTKLEKGQDRLGLSGIR